MRILSYRVAVLSLLALLTASRTDAQSGPASQGESKAKDETINAAGIELKRSGDGLTVARAKESFSTLSLEGSELKPEPPLTASNVKMADFSREFIRLQWRPNDPVDVWVVLPQKVKNPPVVLYLYSYPNNLDRFKNDPYCRRVVSNGAAAVGFESALTGSRIRGTRPMKEWFVSELPESLATTVHDVQLILNYLEKRGDVDMSRVGMFGQGSGGAIAILAAAVESRLKAIDLLNPWGDWPDWLATSDVVPPNERPNYMKPDFLKALEPLEPLRYLPSLKSRPLRIQYSDDENKSAKQAAEKLDAAAPATAKIVHFPTGRALYAVSSDGRLFEWIATALKSQAETKQAQIGAPPAATAR